jgi:hypothetical protein
MALSLYGNISLSLVCVRPDGSFQIKEPDSGLVWDVVYTEGSNVGRVCLQSIIKTFGPHLAQRTGHDKCRSRAGWPAMGIHGGTKMTRAHF